MYYIRLLSDPGGRLEEEVEQIGRLVLSLEAYYPEIENWWKHKVQRELLEGSPRITTSVAVFDGEVAGCCLTTEKSTGVAKINTFIVGPSWQGQSIGFDLLHWELQRLIGAKMRKAYVTFAKENFDKLATFFESAGFGVSGISPSLYRSDSFEVVMDKEFLYGEVVEPLFPEFIRHHVFEQRGFRVESLSETVFTAEPSVNILGKVTPKYEKKYLVRCVGGPEWPNDIDQFINDAQKRNVVPMIYWMWGMPLIDPPSIPEGLVVVDGYDLEVKFSPLSFRRPLDTATILPVKQVWADCLIPLRNQMKLFHDELSLRKTKAFYRYTSNFKGLRRGATVLFYVGGEGIRGEARLERLEINSPEILYLKYGPKGVYTRDEIEDHSNINGQALAYLFSRYREWNTPIDINKIRSVISEFNPITAYNISNLQLDTLRSIYNVYIES